MPFVRENKKSDWDEEDDFVPSVAEFAYITPDAIGGATGPALLAIDPGQPLASDHFGDLSPVLAVALKACGVTKVYCKYDGGNDEGFAWFDRAETSSGSFTDFAALGDRLKANGHAEHFGRRIPWQRTWSDADIARDLLSNAAVDWAGALLGGPGFGTGPYAMYGAFVVDIERGLIMDDTHAPAVIRNTRIEGAEVSRDPSSAAIAAFHDAIETHANDPSLYRVGDRVSHRIMGLGLVSAVDGNKLTVLFDSGETRQLIDAFIDLA